MIVESYMATKRIDHNDVLFVTHRGIKLPEDYKDRILYDGTVTSFKKRIALYKQDIKKYKDLLANKIIYSYAPFQFVFPSHQFFSEYNMIEEGFSAYTFPIQRSNIKGLFCEWAKFFYINMSFPFANRNIKGFLMGLSYSSKRSRKQCKLLISSSDAYSNYKLGKKVEKVIVPIVKLESYPDILNQTILVLDRFNKRGRPFDDVTYLTVLGSVLAQLELNSKKILVKFHPADYCSGSDAKSRLDTLFRELKIEPSYIDVSLEELARSNQGNIFIGTSSTILYYAPILGKSNKSISFVRQLAGVDKQYSEFLDNWGGTDQFCEVFSKQVECL